MKNSFISNIGIGTRNTLDFNQNIPKLIEPGVHGFLKENLRNCGIKKSMYVNKLYNLGMLILFLSILFMILYYKYDIIYLFSHCISNNSYFDACF